MTPAATRERHAPSSVAADSLASIVRLALPSSTVFLLATVVSILMIRFASALGADAVAAVNAGTRLYNVFLAMAAGINAGTLALVANAWGAGNRVEADRLLSLSLSIGAALGLSLMLVTWVGAPALIGLFNLTPTAYAESLSYTRCLALFYAPIAAYLVLVSGLRAAGDVYKPVLLSAIINGLAVWLAWHWTHQPPLHLEPHVRFIAIGFGCGNSVGVAMAIALWRRGHLALQPAAADGATRQRLKALWDLGYPAALEQGLLQLGIVAFLWVVAKHGTAAFAAYGTGITLLQLAMVIGFGFSVAVSVLVGQQIGANQPAVARRVVQRALRLTIVVLTLPGLLLAWYAQPVALWLTGDAEIAGHTELVFYAFTAALPMIGVEFCIGGALRGAGDTRFPLLVVLVCLLVVRFGLALLFQSWGLGVGWIYAALVADYAVKNVLLMWRFRTNRWMNLLPPQAACATP